MQLLAGFLSPPGCLSQHSLPGSLWLEECENPFILDHRMVCVGRGFKDHLVPTPCFGQGCPKLCPTPGYIAHLPCHSSSLLRVTADRGHEAQAALQISALLLPSLLRCRCSGEHLQLQLCHRVTPHISSQAAFQPREEGNRSPFLPPMEVSARRALEQQHRCMGQGQPSWHGHWFIKHQARFPSGANWCCLPDFHPD